MKKVIVKLLQHNKVYQNLSAAQLELSKDAEL